MHPDSTLWINRFAAQPWALPLIYTLAASILVVVVMSVWSGYKFFCKSYQCSKCGSWDTDEMRESRIERRGNFWTNYFGVFAEHSKMKRVCVRCNHVLLIDGKIPEKPPLIPPWENLDGSISVGMHD